MRLYIVSIFNECCIIFCFVSAIHTASGDRAIGLRSDCMWRSDVLPQLYGLLRCHKRKSLYADNGNYSQLYMFYLPIYMLRAYTLICHILIISDLFKNLSMGQNVSV